MQNFSYIETLAMSGTLYAILFVPACVINFFVRFFTVPNKSFKRVIFFYVEASVIPATSILIFSFLSFSPAITSSFIAILYSIYYMIRSSRKVDISSPISVRKGNIAGLPDLLATNILVKQEPFGGRRPGIRLAGYYLLGFGAVGFVMQFLGSTNGCSAVLALCISVIGLLCLTKRFEETGRLSGLALGWLFGVSGFIFLLQREPSYSSRSGDNLPLALLSVIAIPLFLLLWGNKKGMQILGWRSTLAVLFVVIGIPIFVILPLTAQRSPQKNTYEVSSLEQNQLKGDTDSTMGSPPQDQGKSPFSFDPHQGTLKNIRFTNTYGASLPTFKRLMDNAYWLDSTKTGDPATFAGWYYRDPKTGAFTIAPAALGGDKLQAGVFNGNPTAQRRADGALYLHPQFAPIEKPGFYKVDGASIIPAD